MAIVHEWLVNIAGSERVVAELLGMFPGADLHAVVDHLDFEDRAVMGNRHARTTFIQKMPFSRRLYRHYLPLMPLAIEQLDMSAYDVVISSSHAVAKGVITGPGQMHVCYCHTPMRYVWDLHHQYRQGPLTRVLMHYFRLWDQRTGNGVDHFVANSRYIAGRIQKVYGRSSVVIHPPVDVEAFAEGSERRDHYVCLSRLVPYKRVDLVVEAFRSLPDRKLVVVGDGPELAVIRRKAAANIEIMGYQPRTRVVELVAGARAFVMATEEDFGIAPVEAQASGTPVIAFGRGGVLDSVIDGETGVLFAEQSVSSLVSAVQRFEGLEKRLSAERCSQNASRFSRATFRDQMGRFLDERWTDFRRNGPPKRA